MAGAAPTSKPAPFLRPLDTLDRGVLLAETALSVVVVAIMVLVAVAASTQSLLTQLVPKIQNVALLKSAVTAILAHMQFLAGADDLLMAGTLWAAFLGASYATRDRRHLAIDALSRLLPDRGRRVMTAIASALAAFIAFAMVQAIYQTLGHTAEQATELLRGAQEAGAPNATVDRTYEAQYVIPGGFLLIGIRLILHSFHEFLAAYSGTVAVAAVPAVEVQTPEEEAGESEKKSPSADGESDPEPHRKAGILARASMAEVAVSLVALVTLVFVVPGVSVRGRLAFISVLSAVLILAPVIVRYVRTKKFESDERDPPTNVKANPLHMVLALASTIAVFFFMKNGLAPHISQVPIAWGIAFFALMALIGAPLFSFLGGMGLFLAVRFYLASPNPLMQSNALTSAVEDVLGTHFGRMSVLATIPLFTLAGYVMSESKMPQRLVAVSRAALGWLPGGLAVVCVIASAFFTVFSGASGITIVAVGGLLLPALLKDGYPERFSMGLVTTGGALGITILPCLPLIVYGIVAGLQEPAPGQERLELGKFLLAGLIPGIVAIAMVMAFCIIVGLVSRLPRSKLRLYEAARAAWIAKWELALPFLLLGGLATGIFNPSQAAAFTALYVIIIEVFVYKDLTLSGDLPRIIPESMVLVGAIFVKLCAATVLVGFFIQDQTADRLFEWLTCGGPARAYLASHHDLGTCREAVDALAALHQSAGGIIDSKISFLIGLNFFLLIVGMLMDIFSAIVVIVPLIAGIALHFNINPYHLGIVFLVNLEIGYLMPPMGLNLFIAGFRFNRPVPDLYRMVLPFIGVLILALMVITYVPKLSTFLVGSTSTPAAVAAANNSAGTGTTGTPTAANSDGGGAGEAPSCDIPADGESIEAFNRRCGFDENGNPIAAGNDGGRRLRR